MIFIAFLRAINVGGRVVAMADLRREFEALGFAAVESFIASGNIAFRTKAGSAAGTLESGIEERLAGRLGYEVATFLRTPAELDGICGQSPFRGDGSLQVGLLKRKPATAARRAVAALENDNDSVAVDGREVYWHRTVTSASRLSGAAFERALDMPATFRNITTLRRLAGKYGSA